MPIEIVQKMKNEVPKALLNQWLDIKPEKSAFTNPQNCMLDSEEYSTYSDDTISNTLGVSNKQLTEKSAFNRRQSVLQSESPTKRVIIKDENKVKNERRNTLLVRKDTLQKDMGDVANHPIIEMEDFSSDSSETSSQDNDESYFGTNQKVDQVKANHLESHQKSESRDADNNSNRAVGDIPAKQDITSRDARFLMRPINIQKVEPKSADLVSSCTQMPIKSKIISKVRSIVIIFRMFIII